MSSSEDNALTIADLPSDIIREIIKIALEDSFETMRLISYRWNDVAINSLCYPAIDKLSLNIAPNGETIDTFNMRISNEHLAYLGLHKCNPELHRNDLSKSLIPFDHLFGASMNKKWFLNRIALLFNRCSRIAKFNFNVFGLYREDFKLDTIRHVFGDIAIRELSFNKLYFISSLLEQNIVKIVRALSVHRLILTIGPMSVYISKFHFFISILPEVLRVVDEVELTSTYSHPINHPLDWDEALAREEWTNYAADLSVKANVAVNSKVQVEDDFGRRFTLTARKHAEQ